MLIHSFLCKFFAFCVIIIQVFAIEFVSFAVDFVPFAAEFVAFAIEFSPFAIEFVAFAVEFGAFALEFVAFAHKFVIVTLAATNQLLITRWTVFTMENIPLEILEGN